MGYIMTISKQDIIDLSKIAAENQNYHVQRSQVQDEIEKMAMQIYEGKNRNGRTLDKIKLDCARGVVTETAAVMIFGGHRNNLPFDYTNPETYYWDAKLSEKLLISEVKWIEDGCDWVTYYDDNMSTFKKHNNKLDLFLAAKMKNDLSKDYYEVSFVLVANAKTFFDYWRPCTYNKKHFYNHVKALSYAQCKAINLKYT